MEDTGRLIVALALVGLAGGLALLGRGLRAYRRAGNVAGIGTSRIASLAAGEVRIVGVTRELYNDQVFLHNTAIAQVPAVVLAGLLRWRPRPFFDAGEGAELPLDVALGARGEAPGR